jgi:hypothetical protein
LSKEAQLGLNPHANIPPSEVTPEQLPRTNGVAESAVTPFLFARQIVSKSSRKNPESRQMQKSRRTDNRRAGSVKIRQLIYNS